MLCASADCRPTERLNSGVRPQASCAPRRLPSPDQRRPPPAAAATRQHPRRPKARPRQASCQLQPVTFATMDQPQPPFSRSALNGLLLQATVGGLPCASCMAGTDVAAAKPERPRSCHAAPLPGRLPTVPQPAASQATGTSLLQYVVPSGQGCSCELQIVPGLSAAVCCAQKAELRLV